MDHTTCQALFSDRKCWSEDTCGQSVATAVLIKKRTFEPRLEGGEKQVVQPCNSPVEGECLECSGQGQG